MQLVATTIFGQGVEWKLHAIFHFGSERSTLFSLSGAKVPGNESSTHGTFVPGSESTWDENSSYPGLPTPHFSHWLKWVGPEGSAPLLW